MSSASPGGIYVSSAKKRRLAALDAASQSSTGGSFKGKQNNAKKYQSGKQLGSQTPTRGQRQQHSGNKLAAATQQDAQEPQYADLASSVAHGPLMKSFLSLGNQATSVESMLEGVLKTNPKVPDARAAVSSRVHNKVMLLDNPTATLTMKPVRRTSHKRYSAQLAARKDRPSLGERQQYATFMPLHTLWTNYISELLKNCQDCEARLLAADFHGCILTVFQAANPIHPGLTGVVIKDSGRSFTVVTDADRTYHVPKHKSVFCFNIGSDRKVTLLGTNLQRERTKA